MAYVFVNGSFFVENKAVINVKDRGLRFGDGVFETIRIFDGKPYQWKLHMSRFEGGLKVLRINADIGELLPISLKLLEKNNFTNGILRIMITRGSGSAGYLPAENCIPSVIIETMALPQLPETASIFLSSLRKIPLGCLPVHTKNMQGLNSTLARMEAKENSCFEALLINHKDEVCECSSSNIFWFDGDTLFTPSFDSGILPGTIRDAVIRLSPFEVRENRFNIDALKNADEVFITNAAWLIMPITLLQPYNIHWKFGLNTAKVAAVLKDDINS